ncbi:hypothetical protein [Amycolatopsis sp. NPDC057786]|uniref:hypothetical protein n=1 Tax=Amycolatopsis sp. NPDC057786 TaxID=3346250 RepID=UPI00366B5C45
MRSSDGRRPVFGRLDPFCLLAAVPAVLVGALMATQGLWPLGLGCVAFAGLVLLFDSWANRPDPAPPLRRHVPDRPMRTAPVRRPR